MAVVYDERLIIEYAARLSRRAITTVALHVLFGGVFGALIVAIVGGWYALRMGRVPELSGVALVIAAIGALLGYVLGAERAFALRLTAQTALCQAQIERNTRALATALGRALPPPTPRDA